MNATTKKFATLYINAVMKHINSGENLQSAMKTVAPEYKRLDVAEQGAFRDALAVAIGNKYNAKPKVMTQGINKGRLGFLAGTVDGGTTRSDAARVALNYYLPLLNLDKPEAEPTSHASISKYERDVLAIARHMLAGEYTKAKLNSFAADVLAAMAAMKAAKK